MTKIKICGITRESETEVLNRMQVDYAGFVFFEKSKRNVSIEQAKEIKKHLKPSIKTVAVTVVSQIGRGQCKAEARCVLQWASL